jgi:hypothetical protein
MFQTMIEYRASLTAAFDNMTNGASGAIARVYALGRVPLGYSRGGIVIFGEPGELDALQKQETYPLFQ